MSTTVDSAAIYCFAYVLADGKAPRKAHSNYADDEEDGFSTSEIRGQQQVQSMNYARARIESYNLVVFPPPQPPPILSVGTNHGLLDTQRHQRETCASSGYDNQESAIFDNLPGSVQCLYSL